MSYHIKSEKGFSLPEILWAVVILGIAIVMITGVFTGILMSSKKNDKIVVATNLASKQLEYIKLMGTDDIPDNATYDGKSGPSYGSQKNVGGAYFPPYPSPQPAPLVETVNGVKYYYKVVTQPVSNTGSNLLRITVTVSWDNVDKSEGNNFIALELFKAK